MSKPLKAQIVEKARALIEDEPHRCRGDDSPDSSAPTPEDEVILVTQRQTSLHGCLGHERRDGEDYEKHRCEPNGHVFDQSMPEGEAPQVASQGLDRRIAARMMPTME
jgi:hypothetical protein